MINDAITDPAVVEKTETKVEPVATETVTQQGGAETPATDTTTSLPFHKDPEVQKYIDRQLSKREQNWSKQVQELKDAYTKQLEAFNQNRSNAGKPEVDKLPPEQEQALEQLVSMLGPRLREKLGLGKIGELEKQLNSINQAGSLEAFEAEMSGVTKEYAEKYGYDAKELDEELRNYIETDPWFADKSYTKGSLIKAAKLYFADKGQELAERQANLKLIKEQKEKKQNTTEAPTKTTGNKSGSKHKRLEDFLDERVQSEGGIKFD